jgi:hypothetical protein
MSSTKTNTNDIETVAVINQFYVHHGVHAFKEPCKQTYTLSVLHEHQFGIFFL